MKSTQLIPCVIIATLMTTASFANNTNSKEVFNFKDKNGTPVFTDMKPKAHEYKTSTIKTVEPSRQHYSKPASLTNNITQNIQINKNKTIIINNYRSKTKRKKTKKTKRKCKYYKAQLEKVSDKMRAGYRASEYKKLEKRRVKYRNLLLNKCDLRLNPR